MLSEHASKSTEQQEETLQKLGIIRDQAQHVEGLATSILKYVVSRGTGSSDCAQGVSSLKSDLFTTSYNFRRSDDQLKPIQINLSQADNERAQLSFLACLEYNGMIDRESHIAKAHESTFRWVLQDKQFQQRQSPVAKWSNLREWLESDDQLYCITGKAGSGKSTLMKFLCSPSAETARLDSIQGSNEVSKSIERYRCHPYLEKWAGQSKLAIASFYFWNSGIESQMTLDGLLRTLLHQVVSQQPHILPTISPWRWEVYASFSTILMIQAISRICFYVHSKH